LIIPSSLFNTSPTALYHAFDTSEGCFNPPPKTPVHHPSSKKSNEGKLAFLQPDLYPPSEFLHSALKQLDNKVNPDFIEYRNDLLLFNKTRSLERDIIQVKAQLKIISL